MNSLNRLFIGSALALTFGSAQCGHDTNTTADMKQPADMARSSDMFVLAAPVVSSVSPSSAINTGGTSLTINGSGFQNGAMVTIAGNTCANPTITSTQITCTSPAKALTCGSATIVITNPDTQTTSNATAFSYNTSLLTYATAISPAPATATAPRRVISADLDGDGKTDIITSNQTTSNISVLIGKGDGTFNTGVNTTITGLVSGTAIASGDFNNDNKPDLVVVGSGLNAYVLQNSGTGTFQMAPTVSLATAGTPGGVAVGDLDGDGRPDIVVSNQTASSVSVFHATGSNTFGTKADFATANGPESVTTADLNKDGIPDILSASPGTVNMWSRLIGMGNSTYATVSNTAAGTTSASLLVTDLNGDKLPDVVVANAGANTLNVHLQTCK